MSDSFLLLAKETINEIFEDLSRSFEHLELDFVENNLNIELENGKVFIISIHEPTTQIWLSSPYSGAHHFKWIKEENIWKSTRDENINLKELLKKEIN